MQEYLSLQKEGQSEYTDRKSVFYGFARPVSTEEEAVAYVKCIKARYPDARHHVYAYALRQQNITRFTDDGEPGGTAGLPTLDILRKGEITDAVIVVVRYFGGTLLGTGGLVKAYSSAASLAVQDARIIRFSLYAYVCVSVSYQDYQKLIPLLQDPGIRTDDQQFTDTVTLSLSFVAGREEEIRRQMTDLCSGRISWNLIKTESDSRTI